MKTCPCCLRPAVAGLFEKMPEAPFPEALVRSQKEERRDFLTGQFSARAVFGRFFLRAKIGLPLRRENSPLQLDTWIEIPAEAVEGLREVTEGKRRSYSGRASLAADVPGFPGSAGAICRIRCREDSLQILDCSDQRIASLPADLEHDSMAALYRQLWGNSEELPPARWDLREMGLDNLKVYIGEDRGNRFQIKAVEPPPRLAGLDPGEVFLAPPFDTGQPAFLATLGCADVADGNGEHYEILASLQNPSDDLIRCFGEFTYLSRMNPQSTLLGQIVPERKPIPDSDGRMVAWLLVPAEDDWQLGKLKYLQALPLLPVEISFANVFGTESLAEVLHSSGEDLTSLQRGPAVEAIE